jgi:hypothetical protein
MYSITLAEPSFGSTFNDNECQLTSKKNENGFTCKSLHLLPYIKKLLTFKCGCW